MQNPVRLLIRAVWLALRGRVRFGGRPEEESLQDRGERFVAFRKVIVGSPSERPVPPEAIVRVRFRFANLPLSVNRLLSWIPVPFIVAQPGFRSKTWLLGQQTEDFIGLYEFDSVETAEAYWESLPLRMMRRRAATGSLSHEVIPRALPDVGGTQ